jgi:hypothetical protein
MKQAILRLALLIGALVTLSAVPAGAADVAVTHSRAYTPAPRVYVLPFPRGDQAQSVWASSACWDDCGRSCAWGLVECVQHDAQGHCLKLTDRCDRYCQTACRTQGGPFLPIE